MKYALFATLLLVACGGDDAARTTDGGLADAPGIDAAVRCPEPAIDAPWLASFLDEAIGQLTATPRFTSTQRMAARTYLATQLTAMGWTPARQPFGNGENVYATIPATEPSPGSEIIVGAHFDTVVDSPGASDNASGTAVVLALARYLVDTPCRTNPVTIAFFDLEEAGLFGSRAMAMSRTPENVRAVHTIDQVGWDGDGDGLYEIELPTPALEAEWTAAASTLGLPVSITTSEGTDHEAFRNRAFAAVGLSEEYAGGDTSPYRHTTSDTAATINQPYLQNAARLAARMLLTELAP